MNIIPAESTPESIAFRVASVLNGPRNFDSTLLLFCTTDQELMSAIEFRPELAKELERESRESDLMAVVWSRAKASLDVAAAAKAVDDVLAAPARSSQGSSSNSL